MESKGQNGRRDKNDAPSPATDGKQRRAAKRRRWEAKQARREDQNNKNNNRETWIREHEHFCTKISVDDVERIKAAPLDNKDAFLASLTRPYLDLKDAPKQLDDSTEETLFIAEGTETVRLLIQSASKSEDALTVKSIFVKPATLFDPPVQLLTDILNVSKKSSEDKATSRPPFHVLIGDEQAISAVAGFPISRGALACGVVPRRDETWLTSFLSQRDQSQQLRLLALDGICDSCNMGSMIRCAAAFGIDAMILSSDCCDAWYRRSVRVSMGYIFCVPVIRVNDLAGTLVHLREAVSCVSFAAVIDPDSDLVLENMSRGEVPRSWCCVMGNEGNGISKSVVRACCYRLRIGMSDTVDSLSVPIATGILLHGLRERESQDIKIDAR